MNLLVSNLTASPRAHPASILGLFTKRRATHAIPRAARYPISMNPRRGFRPICGAISGERGAPYHRDRRIARGLSVGIICPCPAFASFPTRDGIWCPSPWTVITGFIGGIGPSAERRNGRGSGYSCREAASDTRRDGTATLPCPPFDMTTENTSDCGLHSTLS